MHFPTDVDMDIPLDDRTEPQDIVKMAMEAAQGWRFCILYSDR